MFGKNKIESIERVMGQNKEDIESHNKTIEELKDLTKELKEQNDRLNSKLDSLFNEKQEELIKETLKFVNENIGEVYELYKQRMQAAKEPWFHIISIQYSDTDGVKVSFDYNKEMVNFCKEHGFTGNTDDEIIYSYFKEITSLQYQKVLEESGEFE